MKKTVLVSIVLVLCLPVIAFSQAGKPFEVLQQQISTLQSQVATLNTQVRNLQTQINNIGITAAVHGIRFLDGTQSGTGFTTTYNHNTNVATINFDIPFPGTPHCIATADTLDPTTSCLAVATGASTVDVTCASMVFLKDSSTNEWEYTFTFNPIEQSFMFICVF